MTEKTNMVVETSPALREALARYLEIERHLVGIGKEADPARRLEMVKGRRKLAEQTGMVGTLIENDTILARFPEKQREMSQLFANFRYAFGHHLAKWPAVQTDGDLPDYVKSARDAYGKADLFWAWCMANLDLRGRQSA
jgi:hypothetical protein